MQILVAHEKKEKGHTRLVPCERLVACVIVFKTISSPVLCIFNSGASSIMFAHAKQREALGSRIDSLIRHLHRFTKMN